MPSRPNKVCGAMYCHAIAKSGERYCSDHQERETGWGRWQSKRGNVTQRGYGASWAKLRRRVLERDSYLCANHLRSGKYVIATDVDHIISKASGGDDNEGSLQSLCRACHIEKTQAESKQGRRG